MPTVTQTIRFEGQDAATATANKVKASVQGIGTAAAESAKQTSRIAEKTGDLERGFMGLKDIIGGVADGPLAAVADRMGGIEAVIKGFGPAMGAVGLAIGAAGLAASYLYEKAETARKAALDVEIQRLGYLQNDNEALARHLGVSNELLGVKKGIATVEEVVSAAQSHARDLLKNQQEILEAQKDKQTEKVRLLEIEQSTLKGLLAVDELRLVRAREAAELAKIAAGESSARTREREEREAKIAGIMDAQERLRQKDYYRQFEMAQLTAEDNRLKKSGYDSGARFAEIEGRRLEISRRLRELSGEELSDAREGEAIASARRAKAQAGVAAAKAAVDAQRKRDEEQRKIIDDGFKAQNELQAKIAADNEADAKKAIAAQEAIRKAKIAATEDPQQRLNLERYDIEIRKAKELAAIKESLASADTKALQEAEVQMRAAAELGAAEVRAKEAVAAATAKATNENRKLATSVLDIVGPAAQAAQAVGGPGLSNAFAAAVESGRKLANSWSATESNASGIIGAVGNVAAAVVDSEKEKAGILAVMESAQAVAAFATGDLVGSAAHAAAAVMYGGIAGGLIGGSTGGGAGAAPGGFGAQAQAAPVAGGQGMGGGMTVVNNYNAPLGTRYEIGKSVAESAKAAKAWAKVPAGV